MKYLAFIGTLSISALSTLGLTAPSTGELPMVEPKSSTSESKTIVEVDSAKLADEVPIGDVVSTETTGPTDKQLSDPDKAGLIVTPENVIKIAKSMQVDSVPTQLAAARVVSDPNACVNCTSTVPHPYVQWIDKEVTLCATVYELEETAEQFCECNEKTGECETIVGVQNVRRLVPRKRKWIQKIKYPVIVYYDREVPLKCGTTVVDCPAPQPLPVPGNANTPTPFGGAVDNAPPRGVPVPWKRCED